MLFGLRIESDLKMNEIKKRKRNEAKRTKRTEDEMKIITEGKRELTIKRPDGKIELVDVSEKFLSLNENLVEKIRKATRAAGRGEVLSYQVTEEKYEMEEADYMVRCERCRTKIDARKSYSQKQNYRAGALKTKIEVYYCEACRKLLQSIGAGEYTEMEERAAETKSYEPTTKED